MTAIPLADRQTAVYRLFDAENELLYVGMTHDLYMRFNSHRAQKPWWPYSGHATVEWFANRVGARRHEALAIVEERPRFNDKKPEPRWLEPAPDGTDTPIDRALSAFESGIPLRHHRTTVVIRPLADVLQETWSRIRSGPVPGI